MIPGVHRGLGLRHPARGVVMQVVVASDTGLVRSQNQDRYLVAPDRKLFVVCDGMGGHKGGEVAASLAIDVVDITYAVTSEPLSALQKSIETANQVIYSRGQKIPDYQEMGTTVTAAVIEEESLYVAHVGDSSLYLIGNNQIKKITRDHTLAQKMADEGLLYPEEVKRHQFSHVLTRALGVASTVKIDFCCHEIEEGNFILLATDGLTDLVEDEEIMEIVRYYHMQAHDALIRLALERGGHDNVTIILIQV